jgi:hypothetical protein
MSLRMWCNRASPSLWKPINAAEFPNGRRRTDDSRPWFSGKDFHLNRLRIQRVVVFRRTLTDDATSKEAKNEIGEAKRLLSDHSLDPTLWKELQNRIKESEAALKAYRQNIDSSSADMHPTVGMTTTGNPVGGVVALLALMVGWIFTTSASRSAANRIAAENLAKALKRMTDALMTAVGNVVHDHIVEEARRLAVALGLAQTVGAVTKEILCEMLRKMADQNRRIDKGKWKKIISSMKGLSCRHSRASK